MDRIEHLTTKAANINSQEDLELVLKAYTPLVQHNNTARNLLKIMFHKISKFVNKHGTQFQKDIIIDMRPYFEGPIDEYNPTQVVHLLNSLLENMPVYCTICEQHVDQESCPQCSEGSSYLWDE